MDRRLSIVLAILITAAIGCGSPQGEPPGTPTPGNPPATSAPTTSPSPSMEGTASMGGTPILTGTPPTTTHSVSLTTSTSPGGSGSPSIVTYISESGQDTMAWSVPSGTVSFPNGTNLGVYTPTCASTRCTSGNFSINSVNCPTGTCVGQSFDYTIQAGTHVIYGRIIINR